MHDWYFNGFWFFGWMIFMFLFFFLISCFWWWGGRRGPDYWQHDDKDALQYLKERYAKGEITKEEFERIKHDITSK